jgi:hypothetical protein
MPPPQKHRHRYQRVFAPNHRLRRAVSAPALGIIGKRHEAVTGGHAACGHTAEGCCDTHEKPRSHHTSRIAWAKLMARVGEKFPLECPGCGGDIRLIAFRLLYACETIPGLRTLGNLSLLRTSGPRTRADPEDPGTSARAARAPPMSPTRGPPTDWDELVQAHHDRDILQASPEDRPVIDIRSL